LRKISVHHTNLFLYLLDYLANLTSGGCKYIQHCLDCNILGIILILLIK